MVSGNPSVVLGVKLQEDDGDEEELAGEDLIRYRSVVATARSFVARWPGRRAPAGES